MGTGVENLIRLVRAGLTPETLPEPPPDPDPSSRRPSILRSLFASEPLPEAPPGPVRPRTSMRALLFRREELSFETPRTRASHDWLAILFAPERLDSPGPAGPEVR